MVGRSDFVFLLEWILRAFAPRAAMRFARLTFLVALAVSCSSTSYEALQLPAPSSIAPLPTSDTTTADAPLVRVGLRAGFGRADITPPPGVRLFGYWDESKSARGYRHRLYARAVVLEDEAGQKVAFVVADLGAVSLSLQRLVAQAIVDSTGIGADRLILAATHTHAGPGHFFAARYYNRTSSSRESQLNAPFGSFKPPWRQPVAEYDPYLLDFLTQRIAAAVNGAFADLKPARAAWGAIPVWGFTKNRAHQAYLRNDPLPPQDFQPPSSLDSAQQAVDPTWTMLRIDVLDRERGEYNPAGALSFFAIHGTGNPYANDLLDGDIHSLVERGVERHIDQLNGLSPGFSPAAVHLMANGAVGDVSPNYSAATRCDPPRLRRAFKPEGPREIAPLEEWESPTPEQLSECLSASRAFVDSAGEALALRAVQLFDRLKAELDDRVQVGRAFEVLFLPSAGPATSASPENRLCGSPALGYPFAAGPADGRSRYFNFRALGAFSSPYGEGATDGDIESCDAPKRILTREDRAAAASPLEFPGLAQLAVVRVGSALIAAVPAEVTTAAGARMRDAMRSEARANGFDVDRFVLMGLANGYVQYITTPEEYDVQLYEGASTLYGRNSATVFEDRLRALVSDYGATGNPTDNPVVPAITVSPGPVLLDSPLLGQGPPLAQTNRAVTYVQCTDTAFVVQWRDAYPGRLIPADGPLLRIEVETLRGWEPAVWDDDKDLVVRAVGPREGLGYIWEASWLRPPGGRYRFVLLRRPGLTELEAGPFAVGACGF